MKSKLLGLSLALTLLASAAPTIQPGRACYVYGSKVSFKASEFPGEAPVEILTYFQEDGNPAPQPNQASYEGTLNTGPQGIVEGEFPAPNSGNTGKSGILHVWVRAQNDQSLSARGQVRIVPIAVTPEIVGYNDTNGSVDLKVTGFLNYPVLYCHYIYQQPGKPDKEIKTIKVGALQQPEGSLSLKFKKFPFKPAKGGYIIQFDGVEKYENMSNTVSTPDRPFVCFYTSVV
jgi:hypothetical protein